MDDPCVCAHPACPACGAWYAEQAAADEEAELSYRRYVEDGPEAEADTTDRV